MLITATQKSTREISSGGLDGPALRDPVAKWLSFVEPLFGGVFSFHVGESVGRFDPWHRGLIGGWFWVRTLGGHELRRSSNRAVPAIASAIVGHSDGPNATVWTYPWVGHAANTQWVYQIRSVGGGGVVSRDTTNVLEIVIDPTGTVVAALPNAVTDLQAVPHADGSFALSWMYSPKNQDAEPSDFAVYSDSATGTINYTTPIGTVAYTPGGKHEYTTGVLVSAGITHVLFAVRARVSGGEEKSTYTIRSAGQTDAPYGIVSPNGQPWITTTS